MKKIFITIAITLALILMCNHRLFAEDTKDYSDISSYDFSDIEETVKENKDFDFSDMVRKVMNGNVTEGFNDLGNAIINSLFSEISEEKDNLIKILIIGIVAAMFSNIAGNFISSGIADTGFYITYMLLSGILIAGYSITAKIVIATMDRLIELMEAVTPVYVLSLTFSQGDTSAAGFYQVIVIVIVIIEKILENGIIPLIYIYAVLNFINNITSGTFLTKACELIKSVTEWALKALLSVVIGINVVHSLISPVIDSVKTTAFGKAVSLIPGIGGTLTSVSGVLLGSGTLIKNAIGVTAMIAIIVVSFIPVIKTIVITIGYKAVGALLEPVSDKRIVNTVNGIYDSMVLLLKTLLYSIVLFILTIAIICATTNHNAS